MRFLWISMAIMVVAGSLLSGCKGKNEAAAEHRAKQVCVDAILNADAEKKLATLGFSLLPVYLAIPGYRFKAEVAAVDSEIKLLETLPMYGDGIDEAVQNLRAKEGLNSTQIREQLVVEIADTAFWKKRCLNELKDAMRDCADLFGFDTPGWNKCLLDSPVAAEDALDEYSPFKRQFRTKVMPLFLSYQQKVMDDALSGIAGKTKPTKRKLGKGPSAEPAPADKAAK